MTRLRRQWTFDVDDEEYEIPAELDDDGNVITLARVVRPTLGASGAHAVQMARPKFTTRVCRETNNSIESTE
jgi:hypothetical protein